MIHETMIELMKACERRANFGWPELWALVELEPLSPETSPGEAARSDKENRHEHPQ